MKKRLHCAVFALTLPLSAFAHDNILKAFPQVSEGQQRYVISVPAQDQEDLFKVEVVAGKTMKTDCNTRSFMGDLEEKNLDGWGYSYYQIPEAKGPISTLMACPPGTEQNRFVRLQGNGYLMRYNSKMPIVIYAPRDIEVNYRIWQAPSATEKAPAR